MNYLITFLEGFISFISPCMLPMLPIYISYLVGGDEKKKNSLPRSVCFVCGFTLVFCLLGIFAGTLGTLLSKYQTAVNIVCGIVVIILGLSYLGIIPLNFLKGIKGQHKINGLLSAFSFGMVYSVSLTPCVGAFLGSALMLASSSGGALRGLLLLLVYSLGLGIPFVISAVLIEQMTTAFKFIKKHYKVINTVSGIFLIIVGVLMSFGLLGKLLSLFN